MLKEVIEQRTKIIEEAVAADSIKLQNRIRELERENRELQWNARKLFNAFRQFLIANEKVRLLHLLYTKNCFHLRHVHLLFSIITMILQAELNNTMNNVKTRISPPGAHSQPEEIMCILFLISGKKIKDIPECSS